MLSKVLIVDDAPVVRLLLKSVLERHGFQVVGEASNGNEALDSYKELSPDLVTMDITMPEADGIQGVKNILSFDPNAKIIMITAIDQRKYLLEAIKAGATDYIVKPFEDDRVISALQKAIA
jgi:two-component system chemotaxis response regulator CheY